MTGIDSVYAIPGVGLLLVGVVAFYLRSIAAKFDALVDKVNGHGERIAVLEYRISAIDGHDAHPRRNTGSG